MSELKVILRGETADKLRKLVADGRYAQPEDAVADALDALPIDDDPEIEAWLRDVVAPRVKALEADPSRGLTVAEVRARLRGKL
ncbi:MAG: type II toxin-antitoxin system ParD family antitoxin [Hyphomonadaceae bacterium]|jgi:Arc/MetJ-type ribon-helix-helix transcriptional regulator|nr:type II toxin-antitoxin system ParD family antitoxin [Hyphomonadaceae bacterium]